MSNTINEKYNRDIEEEAFQLDIQADIEDEISKADANFEKRMEEYEIYKKRIYLDCKKSERYLSFKLNLNIRINPSYIYDGNLNKTVEVIGKDNETDFKRVTLSFEAIEESLKQGMKFEDAIFRVFFMNLHTVETHVANTYEKILTSYINSLGPLKFILEVI